MDEIATSSAKQKARNDRWVGDCFVAPLLAITEEGRLAMAERDGLSRSLLFPLCIQNFLNLSFEGREFNFDNMPNNVKTEIEISVNHLFIHRLNSSKCISVSRA